MSLSDLYSSGKHKRDIGHFANIVKLALSDAIITKEEQAFLDRLTKKLNLSKNEAKEIIENPDKYPVNPPIDYDDRIERLFNLSKMVYADGKVDAEQAKILSRIVTALGFPLDNVEKVTDESIHLAMNENDLDTFNKAIKYVNRI